MMSRSEAEALLRELYAARMSGDLDGVCGLFADQARFEIASASNGNPVSVNSNEVGEFRSLLTLLIRAFRVTDFLIISMIIDGEKAAVYWQANIYSKITGRTVRTEFVDIVEIKAGRISAYLEFFVPR
jgi:ketosteroid isomerase-like protein